MTRVAEIIGARRRQQPIVVASAMGKTTNHLLEATQTAAKGKRQEALDLLSKIKDKHLKEAQKMGIAVAEDWVFETIQSYFKEMRDIVKGLAALGELTPRITDAMASYGERLSTVILTQVLENNGIPAQLADARACIMTDDNFMRAAPLFDLTDPAIVEHLRPMIKAGKVPVCG
jgi:aspartate kinase